RRPVRTAMRFHWPAGSPRRRQAAARVTRDLCRRSSLRSGSRRGAAPERQASEHTMGAVVLPRGSARTSRTHGVREPDGAREPGGDAITYSVHTISGAPRAWPDLLGTGRHDCAGGRDAVRPSAARLTSRDCKSPMTGAGVGDDFDTLADDSLVVVQTSRAGHRDAGTS